VLDLLGLPAPAIVQGRSLVPLMAGRKGGTGTELYSETYVPRLHFGWSELRALQAGQYRYIQAPRPELYDLKKDPQELTNLYPIRKALGQELQARLKAVIRKYTPGEELAAKSDLDPAMAARLQALGYVALSSGGGDADAKQSTVDPKDRVQVYELVRRALNTSQVGRYDESIALLQQALKLDPDAAALHSALGLNFYRKRDFASAIPAFQRALDISPNYLLAVSNLGLAYAQSGDMEKAMPLLERTLRMDPSNFSAAFNLGAAYMREDRVQDALRAFRKSVEANPAFGPGHLAVGETLLYIGEVDAAITALEEAARLLPKHPRAQQALEGARNLKETRRQGNGASNRPE
jgi:choline-sulfatase